MRHDEIEGRIRNLEVGLQTAMWRLEALERPKQIPEPPVQPTPPLHAEPQKANINPLQPKPLQVLHPEPPKVTVKIPEYMQANAAPTPPAQPPRPDSGHYAKNYQVLGEQDRDEIEYKFGINGLLRGGAVVILFAVLFLVGTALSRGWITPTMQFIGELLLCFGFIGIGIRKHGEREDFGQLMAGIGSFGLYASFAGAYAFKHLFEGETLVALFMLLSFANLGFSHWRASKSFLSIGLIGGLVAAVMPMQQHKVLLDLALHFAILVPCAIIIVRNKWNGMSTLMWAVSSLALLPATTSDFLQAYRVGATYLNCAIALYAAGKVFKETAFDKYAAAQAMILFLTGCFAIGIDSGNKGSLHAIVLTAIGVGVAYLIRDNVKARNSTLVGSLAVLTILAPIGFAQNVATAIYAVEALVLGFVALRFRLIVLPVLGLITQALSFAAYLCNPVKLEFAFANFTPIQENALLGVYAASTIVYVVYAVKNLAKEISEMALFMGGSLIVAFFLRSLNLFLGNGNTPLHPVDITVLGIGIASLASIGVASRLKRTGMFLFSVLIGITSCVLALVYAPNSPSLWTVPMLLLMSSGTVVLASRYVFLTEDDMYHDPALFMTGLILSGFFLRLMSVAGFAQALHLTDDAAMAIGIAVLNLVWTGFAVGIRRPAYAVLGWLSFAAAAFSGMSISATSQPEWLRPLALLVPILTVATLYWSRKNKESEEPALASLFAFAEWVLVSFLLMQELHRPWIGMKEMAGVTVAWVLVATVLIVCGFMFQRRYLRYWSMGIFMVTVAKVFLIDLAELDSFIRVLCLMLLGLGMVGGGYWYILWRRSNTMPGDQT